MDFIDIKKCHDADEILRKLDTRDLELVLYRFKHGLTNDFRSFLWLCATFWEEGETLPWSFMEALIARFKEIATSDDPWTENLFKRKRGQKAVDLFERNLNVALAVQREMEQNKNLTAAGAAMLVTRERQEAARATPGEKSAPLVSHELAEKIYYRFFPILSGDDTTSSAAKAASKPPLPELQSLMEEEQEAASTFWADYASKKARGEL